MVEKIVTNTMRRLPRFFALVVAAFAACALLARPSALFAHRLDEYLQATLVAIAPGSTESGDNIRLQINLTPGVAVAEKVLALVDCDHDGEISTDEAAAYAELLKHDLSVRLDQRDVELKLTASDFSTPAELRSGSGIIQIEFSITHSPLAAGAHRLTIENRHLPAVSVYLVNAAKPEAASLEITAQKRNENQSAGEIEFRVQPPAQRDAAL